LYHTAVRIPWPILVVALTLPTAGALVYFVAADPESPLFRISYAASKLVQFALPIAVVLALDPARLRLPWGQTSGLSASKHDGSEVRRHGLVVSVAFGLVILAAILGLYFLFLRDGPLLSGVAAAVRAKVTGFGLHAPVGFIVLAVFLSIVHSFLEEYYWRWFVHAGLRERLSWIWAIVLSSSAFAAHHVVVLDVYFPGRFWTATLPFSLGVAVGGVCWAWLYDRFGSLAAPWIAHVLADVALMAVGFDLLYR
jgi:membrane protease YdiL (CAAX protease family)